MAIAYIAYYQSDVNFDARQTRLNKVSAMGIIGMRSCDRYSSNVMLWSVCKCLMRFDARQNYQSAVIQLDRPCQFAWPCKCIFRIRHI